MHMRIILTTNDDESGTKYVYTSDSLQGVIDADIAAALANVDSCTDCTQFEADQRRRWGPGRYEALRPEFRPSAASPDLKWLRDLYGYDPSDESFHLYAEMYLTLGGEECAVLSISKAGGGKIACLAYFDVDHPPQPTIIVPVRELQALESTEDGFTRRFVF